MKRDSSFAKLPLAVQGILLTNWFHKKENEKVMIDTLETLDKLLGLGDVSPVERLRALRKFQRDYRRMNGRPKHSI